MTVRGNGRGEDCGEDEGHVGPNLEGRWAECRPPRAWVIVPMCSARGHIPWGSAHAGGHLKVYLDVAAIRVRRSDQGSNLFQLLERARGRRNGDERGTFYACEVAGVADYGFICTRLCLVRKHNMATSLGEVRHWPRFLLLRILDTTISFLLSSCFVALCLMQLFGSGNKYADRQKRWRQRPRQQRHAPPLFHTTPHF